MVLLLWWSSIITLSTNPSEFDCWGFGCLPCGLAASDHFHCRRHWVGHSADGRGASIYLACAQPSHVQCFRCPYQRLTNIWVAKTRPSAVPPVTLSSASTPTLGPGVVQMVDPAEVEVDVPEKIQLKIRNLEFVEMSDLLPETWQYEELASSCGCRFFGVGGSAGRT